MSIRWSVNKERSSLGKQIKRLSNMKANLVRGPRDFPMDVTLGKATLQTGGAIQWRRHKQLGLAGCSSHIDTADRFNQRLLTWK